MHQGKVQAKGNQIKAEEEQQAAERDAAKEGFITACVELAVVAAISFTGSWMQASGQKTMGESEVGSDDYNKAHNKAAYGEAVSNVSQAAGKVAGAAGNWYSKCSGAQRQADEKRLEAKRHEMVEAMFDDAIDEAKGNYEDAKEQFKSALRIMTEHFERQTQVIQKVTS